MKVLKEVVFYTLTNKKKSHSEKLESFTCRTIYTDIK